jgi:hypothetical protein
VNLYVQKSIIELDNHLSFKSQLISTFPNFLFRIFNVSLVHLPIDENTPEAVAVNIQTAF